jgi:hypothetical protein
MGLPTTTTLYCIQAFFAVRTFRIRACQSRIIIWPGMPSGVPQSNTDPPEQCAPSHDWRRNLLHVPARRAAVKAERKPRPSGRLAHLNRQAFDFVICRPIAAATRARQHGVQLVLARLSCTWTLVHRVDNNLDFEHSRSTDGSCELLSASVRGRCIAV